MPINPSEIGAYYVWLIRRGNAAFVVDTGFNPTSASKGGRRILHPPDESLRRLGVDPATVETLIVTHLHYDHIGNSDLFPLATFHIQDKEMMFATGRYMRHSFFRDMYEVEDVVDFVRKDLRRSCDLPRRRCGQSFRHHGSSCLRPHPRRSVYAGVDTLRMVGAGVRCMSLHLSAGAGAGLSDCFRSRRID